MHFEKYHKNQCMKLLQHYTREHITKNVDIERMKDNVYCCNQILENWAKENNKKIDSDLISSYVGENIGSRQKRKFREDQVVMIDLIITQPTELGTSYNKDFFDKCISVLNSDYVSKNNFLYYSIHNDEKGQPHLHYSFMPFMKDKKGNEKLCAKEFLTRDFLKSFHQDMEKKTGYKLTSEDKTIKNLSMQQYQNKKDMERLQNEIAEQKEKTKQLENEKEELKLKLEDAQKNFNATDKYLSIVKDNINKYQNKIDNGNNEIEKLKDTISQQEKQIEELENKKTTNINTIQNLSDKTINDIETIKKYNLKNEYEDYVITDVKEIKPLELNDLPIKKDMFGNLVIEKKNKENLQKILTVHNELIKQNYKNMCANIFNISEIKKESDNKYNGYKSIKTKNEKLEIENIKLKSSLELRSDYDLIKARYKDLYNAWNHIQTAIDKLDIREPIEKQVNIQQKSRNNGEELTL